MRLPLVFVLLAGVCACIDLGFRGAVLLTPRC
jgi:hypothetical protein